MMIIHLIEIFIISLHFLSPLNRMKWTVRTQIAGFTDFVLLVGWDFWYCGHSWPIVPASGDNEDDCGEADGMYFAICIWE
jgi:hypothetical protein